MRLPAAPPRLCRLPSSVAPSISSSNPLGPRLVFPAPLLGVAPADKGPEVRLGALGTPALLLPVSSSSSSSISSSSSFKPLRNPLAPAPPIPLYLRLRAPSSSILCTAYVISNASFKVANPGLRPSTLPPRAAESNGESSGALWKVADKGLL